jgi:hypothetical protein
VDGSIGGWMDQWSSWSGRMWTEINPAQIGAKCKDGRVLEGFTLML